MEKKMKKVVCLIVVLALAAPIFAGVNFTVTELTGQKKVQIGYNSSGDTPIGIALKVRVTKGLIKALTSYDNTEFPVYIDYAYTAETGTQGSYDIGEGHPLAKLEAVPGALNLAELPRNMVVVCMGRIQTGIEGPNPGPASVANLVTLELQQDPCNNPKAYVTVSAEATYRGGVVGGGDPLTTNLPVGPVEVTLVTYPACWNNTQCYGDGTRAGGGAPDNMVNNADLNLLKTVYLTNYGQTLYNPCSDFNRDGRINNIDLNILKVNYLMNPTPGLCTPGGTWPPVL